MERIWQKSYARGVPKSIYFDDVTLPEALVRTAARFPDNPALIFQGTTLTYRELEDRVARFTSALAGMGIRHGKKVSIILPNLIQTVVAIYATLRTGGIVALHNPRNDEMQMEHQLKVAGAEMVISLDVLVPRIVNLRKRTRVDKIISCHIRDYLPFLKRQLFPLVKKELHLKTPDASGVFEYTDLVEENRPVKGVHKSAMEETAFVLFTSATTGKSKGVELTHANVIRNVQQLKAFFPNFRDGQELVVGCLPFFHSFGLTCALNTGIFYGYGNALVPLPEPKSILEAIHETKATFIPALPTFYIEGMSDPSLKKYDLKSLKGCFSGGAPLSLDTIRSFEKLTGAQFCEGYGLTETSPVSHVNPWGGKTKVGTIGLPLPDTDVKIVDVDDYHKTIETPGTPGELCIKGPQVMRGYIDQPQETLSALKEDGWLLTGDIAVMDDEGYFTIIDRKKDMIVSDGDKIYPRDVDEVLFSHPKVLESCCIGIPDSARGQAVKAFVVLKKNETATDQEIMHYCKQHLSDYQVPQFVEFMETLPRSPIGKVLRKELRRMHLVQASLANLKRFS